MAYVPTVYTKKGKSTTVRSAREAIQLEWEGWSRQGAAQPPDRAHVAASLADVDAVVTDIKDPASVPGAYLSSTYAGVGAALGGLLGTYFDIWDPIAVPAGAAGAVASWYTTVEATLGNKATKTTLGKSGDGVHDVNVYTVGTGPHRVVMAGIHGREGLGQALRFVESFANAKELAPLRQAFTIAYIPLLNPYGYENATSLFPSGGDGNRSWAHFWDRYTDPGGTRPKGASVMAAAECGYLKTFVDSFKPAILIDTHGAAYTDRFTYIAPSPASGGNHGIIRAAAERSKRLIAADGLTVATEDAEGAHDLDPMMHNWFGWYAKKQLGIRDATSFLIEPGVTIDGGSHTAPSRKSIRSYATMLTQVLTSWLIQGRAEPQAALTWLAKNNSGSDTVAIGSGGRMLTITEAPLTWNVISPSIQAMQNYVDVVMPFPGTLEVDVTGWVISSGAAQSGITDRGRFCVSLNGDNSDANSVQFQIPTTVGDRAEFSVKRQDVYTTTPDAANVIRVQLTGQTVYAGGANNIGHKLRNVCMTITARPFDNESRVPRLQ